LAWGFVSLQRLKHFQCFRSYWDSQLDVTRFFLNTMDGTTRLMVGMDLVVFGNDLFIWENVPFDS